MKRWLVTCSDDCGTYALYSYSEPTSCYYCAKPLSFAKGFKKVKGIPVTVVLQRGIYKAPVI